MGGLKNFGFLNWILLFSIGVMLNSNPGNCLYFHMRYLNHEKCFVEDIPEDTRVLVNLTLESVNFAKVDNHSMPELTTPAPTIKENLGVVIEVKDPHSALMVRRSFEGADRSFRISFTSHMGGEHVLCILSNSTYERIIQPIGRLLNFRPRSAPFTEFIRVHLGVKVGGSAMDYEVIQEKEKLNEIQLRIRKLLDLTDQIRKEQDFQRKREERFRATSESTNNRTFWFAILQTALLFIVSYFQIRHLRTFFIMKKLV